MKSSFFVSACNIWITRISHQRRQRPSTFNTLLCSYNLKFFQSSVFKWKILFYQAFLLCWEMSRAGILKCYKPRSTTVNSFTKTNFRCQGVDLCTICTAGGKCAAFFSACTRSATSIFLGNLTYWFQWDQNFEICWSKIGPLRP